ncbi:Equilibrative nucleotide transporter 3 [Dichanthelium oligosanthes]|uniref:Equilibrative nucleotide transporter 3 n=1 Tax=Dichanthelium oligosanthes TaxID=888268 RepID=A0A1E5WBK3_9POAL|nr:Equilibrative nucleotide transporter 3 [Dichanthelium oligosanthes]
MARIGAAPSRASRAKGPSKLLKDMAYEKEDPAIAANQGKRWGIFICWLLGNGCLFGFNSMLTIEDYYIYLFPKYHPTRVVTLTYQPFVLATTAIFTYHEAKVNTRLRNLVGYTLFFLSSFAAIILDVATSGRGGIGPFVGICIIAAAFGVADGHVQGGMTGDLSLMCPEFIQSFFAGLAASGVITSALRFLTKAAFENSRDGLRKGAMLFSSISCFFELLCVLLYAFIFPKLPIVKFYRSKAASEGSLTVTADLAAGGIQNRPDATSEENPACVERLSTKQLLLQNIDYALAMFLIYILTLSIFPGFLAEDTGSHSLGSWYALVLIASYNVWDLIGRYIPLIKQIKLRSRKGLLLSVISRLLLIPAFYYTAKYGDQGWMIMLTSFLGLSNGYLTVCVLTEAPKGYKGPEQNALGNLLVLCLLGGIFCGAVLDWGKFLGILVCWLLGNGSLFAWNSMLTIEDYYAHLFPDYHPTRVLTLAYQPFAFGITLIMTCYEAKMNTRWRNLAGFSLFFLVLFFAITCLFELACLLLYTFVFAKLPIVKYYRAKAAAEGSKTVASDLAAVGISTDQQQAQVEEDPQKYKRLTTKQLMGENIDYMLDIYLIYVLTLSIFPGFLSEDTGAHSLGTWYALVLIAMYNVWDLIGRYVPLIPCLKLTSRKGMMAAILARFLFVPAFYFTANYGDQGYMIVLTSFLGLTNGYLTVCVLMEAPKGYKGPEQNALGNVLVVCLLGGLFSGVVLDWLWLIGKGW